MCALLLGIVGPYVAKLFAYLVELKIRRSQACPVGHCIDGFVKVLLSEIICIPCAELRIASCTESDNDGDVGVTTVLLLVRYGPLGTDMQ